MIYCGALMELHRTVGDFFSSEFIEYAVPHLA